MCERIVRVDSRTSINYVQERLGVGRGWVIRFSRTKVCQNRD